MFCLSASSTFLWLHWLTLSLKKFLNSHLSEDRIGNTWDFKQIPVDKTVAWGVGLEVGLMQWLWRLRYECLKGMRGKEHGEYSAWRRWHGKDVGAGLLPNVHLALELEALTSAHRQLMEERSGEGERGLPYLPSSLPLAPPISVVLWEGLGINNG